MRQFKSVLLPFYWGAQFLGAMLAVIVLNWITGNALHLDFSHLWNMDWAIFGVELVAAAVLMFGYAAATSHKNTETSPLARSLSVGFAIVTGLVIGTSLLASVQSAIDTSKITSLTAIPHQLRVKNVSANPAVALAMTEQSDSAYSGSFNKDEKQISRFSLEVLFGTLVGAALGGNLYLLIAGRKKN
jgi:glycerol uptake facilitator-like aquaporin